MRALPNTDLLHPRDRRRRLQGGCSLPPSDESGRQYLALQRIDLECICLHCYFVELHSLVVKEERLEIC